MIFAFDLIFFFTFQFTIYYQHLLHGTEADFLQIFWIFQNVYFRLKRLNSFQNMKAGLKK